MLYNASQLHNNRVLGRLYRVYAMGRDKINVNGELIQYILSIDRPTLNAVR